MVDTSVSSVSCIVPGCCNSSESSPEKVFFTLSADEERFQHWLLVCRREDLLKNQPHHQELAVCSDHFIRDHFVDYSFTKLTEDAVPTIFPSVQRSENNFLSNRNTDEIQEEEEEEEEEGDNDEEEDVGGSFFVLNGSDRKSNEDNKDFQKLCRLCANASDDLVYLFSPMGKSLHLPRKINMSLPVTVQDTDPLPKQLCTACLNKVNLCHDFAELCLTAEKKLMSLMKRNVFHSGQMASVEELIPGTKVKIPDSYCSEFWLFASGYKKLQKL